MVSEETLKVPGLLPGAIKPPDPMVTAPSVPAPESTEPLELALVAVTEAEPSEVFTFNPPPLSVIAPL
jgi:hypothetical protein